MVSKLRSFYYKSNEILKIGTERIITFLSTYPYFINVNFHDPSHYNMRLSPTGTVSWRENSRLFAPRTGSTFKDVNHNDSDIILLKYIEWKLILLIN